MSDPLRFLEGALGELERHGQLRVPPAPADLDPRPAIALSSNDYLGFAAEPWPAGPSAQRSGAGASALLGGYHLAHHRAEFALAEFVRLESALMFSSGYAANLAVIAAVADRGDLIVSDALNHASIVDGCRLSRAEVRVVSHVRPGAVEAALEDGARFRRRLVVTESYFSMDADGPDLGALARICSQNDAVLMVDEAHALGVFGPQGRGACARAGIRPDVLVGTLGKAFGLHGAFVAGSARLRTWLWNRARSFVFSTATMPALAAAVPERVAQVERADVARKRLAAFAASLRAAVAGTGATVRGEGPIIPWVLGAEPLAERAAHEFRARGVLAPAIRPPTVAAGTSRVRIVASAGISDEGMKLACDALRDVAGLPCFT